mmetsp:Transcript_11365/g.17089  ORF Transcript_11365/g.17089 Transcript_11365/m.17089 type:complete len:362 (+) Transcript_11365:1301-2386(+)
MQRYVFYFFQGEPCESMEKPNAFIIKGLNPTEGLTLGTFLKHLPMNSSGLHFRFRVDDPKYGFVWQDLSDVSAVLPSGNQSKDVVHMVKILRLATDPAHLLRRRYYLKTKKLQSDVSANLDCVDVDRHVNSFDRKDGIEEVKGLKVDDEPENSDPIESNLETNSNEYPQPPSISVSSKSNTTPVEVDMLNFDTTEPSSSSPVNNSSKTIRESPSMKASTLNREELVANREKETEMKVKEALNFARMLGDKAQQESVEVDEAKAKHEVKLKNWAMNNKEKRNVRTLLSTMHTVLWPGHKWKPIGLGDVIDPKQVKLQYRKAMLVVHPDRCSNTDTETRFIAKRVFEAINEAYEEFLKNESPQ